MYSILYEGQYSYSLIPVPLYIDIIDAYCEDEKGLVDNAVLIESLCVNIPMVKTANLYSSLLCSMMYSTVYNIL